MRERVFVALGAVSLFASALALAAQLADTGAQGVTAPAYEIEVLPGVADSDPENEKRWAINAAGNASHTGVAAGGVLSLALIVRTSASRRRPMLIPE